MIVAAAFTPDNNQLFIGCNFRASSVWDLTSARPPRLTLPHRGVTSAQFSPDGTRVVTTGSDNYARIWDANTGQSIGAAMGHDKSVTDARWSPDGHRIVTASEDRTARIWDAATGLPITPAMKQATIIGRVIFSPDGKQVATGATAASYDSEQHGSEAMLWDAATGKPLSLPLRATERIVGLQFTLAGPRAILTSSTNDSARVYDIRTGAVVGGPFPTDQFPLAGVLSRDGARVIIGSADGSLRIWNVATGKLLREPLPHGDTGTSPIFDLALDANDTRVVSAGGDGTARVWNTNTGKSVAQWLKHRGIIVSAAFSPDGARVVTASIDGTARVWDSATGQPLSPPLLHPVAIGASFSPDGTHVLSIGSGKAIIWAIGQSALTPADALSFSELISGQTLDDGDGLRPLTRDEWLERGRELKHYRPLPASHPASMLVPTAR
jgi:WD40 repeat protein